MGYMLGKENIVFVMFICSKLNIVILTLDCQFSSSPWKPNRKERDKDIRNKKNDKRGGLM